MIVYISLGISVITVICCIITMVHNLGKDNRAEIIEPLLKANLKLDSLCSQMTETRTDIKALNRELKDIDKRVSILEQKVGL